MSLRRLCEITLEPRAFFRDKHLSSGLTTAVIFNVGLNVSIFSADLTSALVSFLCQITIFFSLL